MVGVAVAVGVGVAVVVAVVVGVGVGVGVVVVVGVGVGVVVANLTARNYATEFSTVSLLSQRIPRSTNAGMAGIF
jgi:hypothetical protein